MNAIQNQHILISRVDAIGDVVLTLPMCGYLKSIYPGVKISFLGTTYTGPVIKTCAYVDHFIDYHELRSLPIQQQEDILRLHHIDVIIHVYPQKQIALLAMRAGIATRIGTVNRPYHWFTCNKLVKLSRKNSYLHEAQLNIILLKPLGITRIPTIEQLADFYDFNSETILPDEFAGLLTSNRFNLILHPKSNGSGREWGLDYFAELVNLLPPSNFNIFISGSSKEQALLSDWIAGLPQHVIDITGKLTLEQFISFIAQANGLVASGTGPLHIAAAYGIHALGLFPGVRPIHAGRWGPIGKLAEYIDSKEDNLDSIKPSTVYHQIQSWL